MLVILFAYNKGGRGSIWTLLCFAKHKRNNASKTHLHFVTNIKLISREIKYSAGKEKKDTFNYFLPFPAHFYRPGRIYFPSGRRPFADSRSIISSMQIRCFYASYISKLIFFFARPRKLRPRRDIKFCK